MFFDISGYKVFFISFNSLISEAYPQRQYNVHNMFPYFKMIINYFVHIGLIVLVNFNGFIIRYICYNLTNCHAPMNVSRTDLGAL